MANTFDLIVIGAGPGGYVAAIRAAQLGMDVAVVEKRPALGGTCLNVGCIPSKALLESSEHYHRAAHQFEVHGIKVGKLELDYAAMAARKDKVVSQTVDGINYLFKKNKITSVFGTASFVDEETICVTKDDGSKETLIADNVIIATGSEPTELPFAKFDEEVILSSTGALALTEVPESMVVIGGGVIGLELGSVFARLGCKVSVVEFMDRITPGMDKELSQNLQRVLKKLGMSFSLSTKVTKVTGTEKGVAIEVENKKGKASTIEADRVLVSVGRRPYTTGLNLEAAGIKVDQRGFIEVDDHLETSAKGIYAIGDVIAKGPMLAHKAEEEGVMVVEALDGQKPHMDYNLIPGVIYTWPEVASVGKTEEQLVEEGIVYKTGKFPFRASGRARAGEETDGFVKVLADGETDEILGIHMIGPRCADLIAEAVVAMEFKASAEDIARICHAHPTYAEPIKEAAMAATGSRAIHI